MNICVYYLPIVVTVCAKAAKAIFLVISVFSLELATFVVGSVDRIVYVEAVQLIVLDSSIDFVSLALTDISTNSIGYSIEMHSRVCPSAYAMKQSGWKFVLEGAEFPFAPACLCVYP